MKYTLSIFTLFYFTFCYACLNISGTNIDGEYTSLDMLEFIKSPTDYPDQDKITRELERLNDELLEAEGFTKDDIFCDIAGYMIYNGDYEAAIEYLKENVVEKNLNYSYSSNIAVAYELVGNLDSALYYTNKAIEIDPNSHEGSEWIHARILEVTQKLNADPNWLDNNNFFEFEISTTEEPTIFSDSSDDLLDFAWALGYQLKERTYFVKPEDQDKIVGHLLLILADLYAREYDTGESKATYQLAAEYDSEISELVEARLDFIIAFEEENNIESYEYTDETGYNLNHDNKKDAYENEIHYSNQYLDDIIEDNKSNSVLPILYWVFGILLLTVLLLAVFLNRKK